MESWRPDNQVVIPVILLCSLVEVSCLHAYLLHCNEVFADKSTRSQKKARHGPSYLLSDDEIYVTGIYVTGTLLTDTGSIKSI